MNDDSPFEDDQAPTMEPAKKVKPLPEPRYERIPPLGKYVANRSLQLSGANLFKGDKFKLSLTNTGKYMMDFDDIREPVNLTHGYPIHDMLDREWLTLLEDSETTAIALTTSLASICAREPKRVQEYASDMNTLLDGYYVNRHPYRWVKIFASIDKLHAYMHKTHILLESAGFVPTATNAEWQIEHAILGKLQMHTRDNTVAIDWMPFKQKRIMVAASEKVNWKKVHSVAHATRKSIQKFSKHANKHGLYHYPGHSSDLCGWCAISSAVLQHRLKKHGIKSKLTVGHYSSDGEHPKGNREQNHTWLRIGTKNVDITAGQFGKHAAVHVSNSTDKRYKAHKTGKGAEKALKKWDYEQNPFHKNKKNLKEIHEHE